MSTDNINNDDVKFPKNPEFSIKDIRAIIPKHLFKRSYLKAFYWLIHDIILVIIMFYLSTFITQQYIPFIILRIILWFLWWYVEGAFMVGLWVIAHECGHHAFTPNKLINNIVGFILHTMLLVPYFSWQYTHQKHHLRTNNLEFDTVHCPRMKDATEKIKAGKLFNRLKHVFKISLLGWPLYLLFDARGPVSHVDVPWVNHFNPYCMYFPKYMIKFVLLSDIGLICWIYCLYRIYKIIGFINIIFYYFIPYLIVNHWLVILTFLHHMDWNIGRYKSVEWMWLRGAFGTIDRNYGIFLNYTFHHIQDSHVIHHLFSTMPHYNAIKATKYLKKSPIFSKYYLESNQAWYSAFWDIEGTGIWTKKNENILQIKKISI